MKELIESHKNWIEKSGWLVDDGGNIFGGVDKSR